MNTKHLDLAELSLSDAAIDGLIKGLLAGIIMLLYLVITSFLLSDGPAVVLGRFSPDGNANPLLGLVVHLGVSAIYGAIFGLICWMIFWRRLSPAPRLALVLAGLVFGLIIGLFAQFVLLPGSGSGLTQFTAGNLAAAHLLYGTTLGLLANRSA